MTRAADTYRAARRNDWHSYHRLYRGITDAIETWRQFNVGLHGTAGYGIPERIYQPSMARAHVARSKYMPHIGDKQRAKGIRRSAA
jgi:hypothetical protein